MAESNKRVYVVSEFEGDKLMSEKLVRAGSQAAAIRHIVGGRFSADAAKSEDVVRLMTEGVTVQDAGAE